LADSPLLQLHHVLDLEKQALISADFDPLGDLLQQKEKLLGQLVTFGSSPALLRPIRAKMDENQALLAAAIKGVAAAGERLEALHNVQKTLSVYDDSGRVELVQQRKHNLEMKA